MIKYFTLILKNLMACTQNCINSGLQGTALTRCIAACNNQNTLIPSIPTFQNSFGSPFGTGFGIDPSLLSVIQSRRLNQSIDPEQLTDLFCNRHSDPCSRVSRFSRFSRRRFRR